jgi:hypothetical protein
MRQFNNLTWRALFFFCSFIIGSRPAKAADLFVPGIQPKAGSGAGQTISRGASALFFNPANLIFAKHIEPTVDISYAKITYTYLHTDESLYPDEVAYSTKATPVTVGLALRLIPNFAAGVAIFPTGAGETRLVKNVPLFVPGLNSYPANGRVVDVATAENGLKIAGGAAVRLGSSLVLGLSTIFIQDKFKQYQVALPDEEPFIDVKNQGSFTQFVGGMRAEVLDRRLAMALSFKTPVTKKYKGDYILDTSFGKKPPEEGPLETTEYLPMAIGFALEGRMGAVGLFVDFVNEQWSKGRTLVRRGFQNDPGAIDLKDTNNIAAGIKLWPSESHMLTVSFGMHGSNIGDGSQISNSAGRNLSLTQNAQAEDDNVGGMTFGNLEGIPRTIMAGGYRYKISGHGYVELAGQYQKGHRIVPVDYAQEGLHSLQITMGSVGVGYGF